MYCNIRTNNNYVMLREKRDRKLFIVLHILNDIDEC